MKLRICAALVACFLALTIGPSRAETPTVKVGMASMSMFTIIFHVAEDKGFFAKEGVKVEINHFESGSILMKALLSRAIDVADVEAAAVLSAVANNGADLRIFGTQAQRLHFALYAKKDIKSVSDLYGRTFAISGIGGLPHVVILALMQEKKLDVDKLTMLAVGGTGARLSALAAGKVDATVGEFSPKIESDPNLRRLLIVSPELPGYVAMVTTAWADTLTAKRDALEKYQRAMVEATRWAYANKQGLIEIAAKHIPLSKEELGQVYDFYLLAKVWAINGEIPRSGLEYMQKLGLDTKTQSKPIDLNKLVDQGIYDDIIKSLGVKDYPFAK
jgi:NitT/TauT family transport system substrate-binding protein